jgi:hypothetical protein
MPACSEIRDSAAPQVEALARELDRSLTLLAASVREGSTPPEVLPNLHTLFAAVAVGEVVRDKILSKDWRTAKNTPAWCPPATSPSTHVVLFTQCGGRSPHGIAAGADEGFRLYLLEPTRRILVQQPRAGS